MSVGAGYGTFLSKLESIESNSQSDLSLIAMTPMSGDDAFLRYECFAAAIAEALNEDGGTISVQVLNEFISVARRKLLFSWPAISGILLWRLQHSVDRGLPTWAAFRELFARL